MRKPLLALFAAVCLVTVTGSSSSAGPEAVYGPEVFTREVAGPDTFSASFKACDPEGSFTLIIDNGGVSSATVSVNGAQVVSQSEFNKNVSHIEKPLSGLMEQNTIEVRMQSAPGSNMSVSVLSAESCGLRVDVESPSEGSVLSGYATAVTGTIDAQEGAEVGVMVNGVPAEVCGTRFAMTGVPLLEGDNVVRVVATDDTGNTAEDSVSVTVTGPVVSPVSLSVYPAAGQAPLDVKFDVSDTVGGASIYELDYDGDGVVDVTAQSSDDLVADASHEFGADGLYFPTLRVTDTNGNVHTATALVNVFPMPDLTKKWDGMRAALEAGDVETAAGQFSLGTREGYANMFKALADAGALADAVSRMGEVSIVETMGNAAEGDMRVNVDGKEYSFYVLFEKDEDGIWRIRSF